MEELIENTVDLEYVKKYVENYRFVNNPFFCPMCILIRGVNDKHQTYLDPWETLLYNSRDMCSKCFRYLNNHSGEKDLEDRIKLWEESNWKIKRAK